MQMKRILPIILVVCMMLCACSQAPAEQTTEPPVITTTENVTTQQTTETTATTEATEETTVPETTEETVPVVLYRNPLNGMPMEEPYSARPFAVMINNIVYAQPMCSISNADFLFEVLAEGGITRCLAVFSDVSGVEHIGSIRSARPYYVDLASSFNAIYAHHGGTDDGYNMIHKLDVDDIDAWDDNYFRDQARLDAGYALEHTSFTHGQNLIEAANEYDYDLSYDSPVDYGFRFDEFGSTADGDAAESFDVVFGYYGKTTTLNYNGETGFYNAYQHNGDMIDGNTDEVVDFRNVLVIKAYTSTYEYGNTYVLDIELTGEGTGYFACDGKIVPIVWSRADQYSPFVFAHEDGTPITFGVGSTYAAIVPGGYDIVIK